MSTEKEMQRLADTMDMLYNRIVADEGKSPNLKIETFALAQTDDPKTIKADYLPDHWVVYFRSVTNGRLAIYPGDYVPAVNFIELETGRAVKIAHVNQSLTLENTGTADIALVVVVAVGGGAEFEITSI